MAGRLMLIALAVLAGLMAGRVGAVEVTAAEIANRRCSNCHAKPDIGELSPRERAPMVAPGGQPSTVSPPAKRPGLSVTPGTMAGSVHAKLACIDCHADAEKLPHVAKLQPATCNASCHSSANSDHLQGVHAAAMARGIPNAPTCGTCHGSHEIVPVRDRQSRVNSLNVINVCGDCHANHVNGDEKPGANVAKYMESVHGRALAKGALSVAASCADCHGSHLVLPSEDPRSAMNRGKVSATCGKCHTGPSETYVGSIHGLEMAKGNLNAPVCSDCHTAHSITRTGTPGFKLDIINECGDCHDKPIPGSKSPTTLYETYRQSYHGQVTNLGFARGARCSDCHGAHDVTRANDPVGRLAGFNRVETCRQCHPKANEKFAQFQPHADPRDAKRYPILFGVRIYFIIMMSFAFGFFGLHSVLWFIRSAIERIKHGPHPHMPAQTFSIQRFNRVDRINHAFVIISFFGLTMTGLPLYFSDKGWALTMMTLCGGVEAAGVLHRFFAIILILNFVVHGVGVFRRMKKYGPIKLIFGPTTMLPRWKDITDCLGMWRWFFKGGQKPKFDRWTYWEKFDYVAEVGGSGIIGLTGLMLWFPDFFAKFLPGSVFNIASLVHGLEALLAIGFIFTIHFFNAHLRLEKFPVDDVMFTGRLPEEEFKHERGAEYERLVAEGKLDELRVAPAPAWYRKFAVFAGITAMAVGTTLVVLIILAATGVM